MSDSSGGGGGARRDGPRRPLRYWDNFNSWWRDEFARSDPPQRPTAEQIARCAAGALVAVRVHGR
jgi:hypothetical protein